jgi:hypothetical protein
MLLHTAGHHWFDGTAGLGAFNALRVNERSAIECALAFASTPRSVGPSGIDRAVAQRDW